MRLRVGITGGAGFVGSNLALFCKRDHPDWEVVALDNLTRRGSELALARLDAGGIIFRHGDVRCRDDLEALGPVDLMIECSAEPSVHAGYDGSPAYLVQTNLGGTVNCLEHLRRHGGHLVFLSTSRVYPIQALRQLPLERSADRFVLKAGMQGAGMQGAGWSSAGISESFPLAGSRSLYGATKLASELLIEEYAAMYGLKAVINRCGVLAGPWQMGKVDQGFVVLWLARHLYGGDLKYMGFGGHGLQVRDILHVSDLYDLLKLQIAHIDDHAGRTYNVGGGAPLSVSLKELTALCQRLSGRAPALDCVPETRPADIPYYVTDSSLVQQATGWRPRHSVESLLDEVSSWLKTERSQLEHILRR